MDPELVLADWVASRQGYVAFHPHYLNMEQIHEYIDEEKEIEHNDNTNTTINSEEILFLKHYGQFFSTTTRRFVPKIPSPYSFRCLVKSVMRIYIAEKDHILLNLVKQNTRLNVTQCPKSVSMLYARDRENIYQENHEQWGINAFPAVRMDLAFVTLGMDTIDDKETYLGSQVWDPSQVKCIHVDHTTGLSDECKHTTTFLRVRLLKQQKAENGDHHKVYVLDGQNKLVTMALLTANQTTLIIEMLTVDPTTHFYWMVVAESLKEAKQKTQLSV